MAVLLRSKEKNLKLPAEMSMTTKSECSSELRSKGKFSLIISDVSIRGLVLDVIQKFKQSIEAFFQYALKSFLLLYFVAVGAREYKIPGDIKHYSANTRLIMSLRGRFYDTGEQCGMCVLSN